MFEHQEEKGIDKKIKDYLLDNGYKKEDIINLLRMCKGSLVNQQFINDSSLIVGDGKLTDDEKEIKLFQLHESIFGNTLYSNKATQFRKFNEVIDLNNLNINKNQYKGIKLIKKQITVITEIKKYIIELIKLLISDKVLIKIYQNDLTKELEEKEEEIRTKDREIAILKNKRDIQLAQKERKLLEISKEIEREKIAIDNSNKIQIQQKQEIDDLKHKLESLEQKSESTISKLTNKIKKLKKNNKNKNKKNNNMSVVVAAEII